MQFSPEPPLTCSVHRRGLFLAVSNDRVMKKTVVPMSSTPASAIQGSLLKWSGVYCIPRRSECCLEIKYVLSPSLLKMPCEFGQVFKARCFLGGPSVCRSGHLHLRGACLAGYPRICSADHS